MKIAIVIIILLVTCYSCSKKSVPATASINTSTVITKDNSAIAAPVGKKKNILTIPKIISVNDAIAKKTLDGRYYYDLQGRRYWRNNKDGKYHLFNKVMYTDDAYKPQ